MKKAILFISLFFAVAASFQVYALDEAMIYKSVVKIQNYEYNSTSNTYSLSSIGSAVVVGTGLLLTNAHVIFNALETAPSGFYEVCRTIDFMKKTVCFTPAELIAYDETNDLALLHFYQPSDLPITPIFKGNQINIGASLIMYGYPAIGGDNITRTEGKVAGYEDPFYKIDGAIDHGNSGGGAFNKYGELVGVPSRVSSDNAVIGYMMPITTIHDFLNKKTKGYTPDSIKAPADFKAFIQLSELGERSKDIINDINTKTLSLKKFGLKFVEKIEGTQSFLYSMRLNNLGESSLAFGCFQIAGVLDLEQLDEKDAGDGLKKYKKTSSIIITANGKFQVDEYQSLLYKDGHDKVNIYDLGNTCGAYLPGVTLTTDKQKIDKVIAFITTGITLKKPHKPTIGFDTTIFHIGTLPVGISIATFPGLGGEDSVALGYSSVVSNTGETIEYLDHTKKDTLNNYFLGGDSYSDNNPSDITVKPEDYSFDTYKKIYEKKYSGAGFSNGSFTISETKNNKKILIGTVQYKSPTKVDAKTTNFIIVAYPYMITHNGKQEYHELTYSNGYEGDSTAAIAALKDFFIQFEPIGTAPF